MNPDLEIGRLLTERRLRRMRRASAAALEYRTTDGDEPSTLAIAAGVRRQRGRRLGSYTLGRARRLPRRVVAVRREHPRWTRHGRAARRERVPASSERPSDRGRAMRSTSRRPVPRPGAAARPAHRRAARRPGVGPTIRRSRPSRSRRSTSARCTSRSAGLRRASPGPLAAELPKRAAGVAARRRARAGARCRGVERSRCEPLLRQPLGGLRIRVPRRLPPGPGAVDRPRLRHHRLRGRAAPAARASGGSSARRCATWPACSARSTTPRTARSSDAATRRQDQLARWAGRVVRGHGRGVPARVPRGDRRDGTDARGGRGLRRPARRPAPAEGGLRAAATS